MRGESCEMSRAAALLASSGAGGEARRTTAGRRAAAERSTGNSRMRGGGWRGLSRWSSRRSVGFWYHRGAATSSLPCTSEGDLLRVHPGQICTGKAYGGGL